MNNEPAKRPTTPGGEALSLCVIFAILAGGICYTAAIQNWPVLSPALFWLATWIYRIFPAIGSLRVTPELVTGAGVGVLIFVLSIPLSLWLANGLGDPMDRQAMRLIKRPARAQKRKQGRGDKFIVH
jgi:hypothetical protein